MNFRIGDLVGYLSVLGDNDFQHIGRVRSVHPDGIPSCKEPMVMIEGKAGVVLAEHCVHLPEAESPPSLRDAIAKTMCHSSWCACNAETIADVARAFIAKEVSPHEQEARPGV